MLAHSLVATSEKESDKSELLFFAHRILNNVWHFFPFAFFYEKLLLCTKKIIFEGLANDAILHI